MAEDDDSQEDLEEKLRRQGIIPLEEAAKLWKGEPWSEFALFDEWITLDDAKAFHVVVDNATDEASIQKHLSEHPALLSCLGSGGHGKWVFPKLRLGSELVTDFAVVDCYSSGYEWRLIELESPSARVLTRAGREPSKEFRHAKQQVDDWRIWLRKNVAYAQEKYEGLDDTFWGIIIMGRRKDMPANRIFSERYRELSRERLKVMSYDRLLELVSERAPKV